jgi:adenylate cyclase
VANEIERKFLVKAGLNIESLGKTVRIVQGYLSSVNERTVRVRIKGDKGFLTIKGIGNKTGTTRFEWEQELPVALAEELLKICEPGLIEKTRTEVPVGSHIFEIDKFTGDNLGLIVAEVELNDENEKFDRPEWLAQEVTGDARYYNSMLMKTPYTKW